MGKGWIKLHRQFLEWEWYDEPNCTRVFLHCLLKANHKDKRYSTTSVAGTSCASIPLNVQVCAYPAHTSNVPN